LATPFTKTPAKTNYLNNRDILKQIHLSKNTYCSYLDPVQDHQYDIILPTLLKINQRTIAEARRNRADRIRRETAVVVDPKKIPNTDLVFRIICWEHIPMAPKKIPKTQAKKKKIEDIFELELESDDPLADLIDIPVLDPKHVRLPFPPFYHYRLDENKQPFQVGKSHWIGDFAHGEFSKEHGTMTRTLATMFMKLCERYATRSNWRGYCVDTETEALTQRGWLRENEITEDDTILSYENNDLTWSKIKSIYRGEFDGLMHKLTNRGIDALITPGHKIVTNRGLVPVEYLLQSDKIIMLGNPVKTNNEPKYSNSMVELLGWILAEGNYQPKKQLVTIYQNEGVYADRIRVCLNTLNFKFSESTGRKNISFLLNRPASNKIFSILPVKNLSMEFILDLTLAQRELLINTMVDGDGWSRSSGWSYTQKNATHVDLFQALCAISGHKTNSHFATHKSFGKQVSYFNINKFASNTTNVTSIDFHGGSRNGRGLIGRGKATHPNQPTTHYTGIVWCPETEYGCFVARRAGKVYLTGNTYNEEMRGQALLQLSQIGLQFDESKSQNPFAYYTAAITNSFTRILNLEKKNQNIRDDMLEQAGLNPSWTRQNAGKKDPNFGAVVVVTSGDDIVQ
jgi:hypothetical protein